MTNEKRPCDEFGESINAYDLNAVARLRKGSKESAYNELELFNPYDLNAVARLRKVYLNFQRN